MAKACEIKTRTGLLFGVVTFTFFVTLTLIFLQFESLQDLFTIDFLTTRVAGYCGPVVLCVM